MFHDGARPAEGRQRHAAADHLAEHGQVGPEAGNLPRVQALRTAERHAEARHHLVQDQQRAVLRAQFTAASHEWHAGAHEIHVPGDRLDDHAGQVGAVQRERVLELLHVVVFQDDRVLHHFGRHAGAGGIAEGGQARAGLHQQRVGMAVVAALELDQLAAAGGAARQADRTHPGLGPRAHQPHHLDRRHEADDRFGELHFALGRRTEGEAFQHGALHGLDHRRVAMPQDHRPPRADVVDVALAVGIPEVRALGALHETGGAADGAEGAHRRIHAAGNELAGPVEQGLVAVSAWCHGRACRGPAGPSLLRE